MKLDKSPITILDMFNSIASQYDVMNDIMTGFSHRRTRKIAAQLSGFKSNEKVLDLATGTGDFAFRLYSEAQGTIIGTDISEKMLSIALLKTRRLDANRFISYNLADITRLPFLDETFNLCTIGFGIRNVPDPLSAMIEVARVTKKGGRFIIVEATPSPHSLVKFLSLFHFQKLAPLFARLLSSNVSAYNYFAESISQFPKASDFAETIKQAGWKKVYHQPLYLGIVTIFIAIK
ncbi:MAG: ubiquinone/menaquinone biosynthesis methyltransferase [Candidatus Heimdallarchaeota archaeon]|nr:MAG: ubiquinone/menaquinone biosynthesis methyltransferase [Candidatus Heimdallarchaeota archaeon]